MFESNPIQTSSKTLLQFYLLWIVSCLTVWSNRKVGSSITVHWLPLSLLDLLLVLLQPRLIHAIIITITTHRLPCDWRSYWLLMGSNLFLFMISVLLLLCVIYYCLQLNYILTMFVYVLCLLFSCGLFGMIVVYLASIMHSWMSAVYDSFTIYL